MAATGLETFDRTVHQTNSWLNDISDRTGRDRQHSWHAMRAVLQAMRDRLTPGEAAKLAAELPLLVRGLYFEGYKPESTPTKHRHLADFLDDVRQRYALEADEDMEALSRAVLAVVRHHVSTGEVDKVCQQLPEDLSQLWS